MGQQWLSAGTGVWQQQNWEVLHVACILLEEVTISPTIEPRSRWPTNLRTTIPKKFLPYCKCSRVHKRFLNLGTQQRDWKPPVNLTLKASGIWLQNFHRTREADSWWAQTKPCAQEKGAVTPQVTKPDLPVGVRESLAEVWVDNGLLQCQGHWIQQSWESWHADISPFEGGCHYPYHRLASGQTTGRDTAPPVNRNWVKIYWIWPCPSEQDQDSPTASPSHQGASQDSYPYPSEDRQTENHNHRKLTKLITWITAWAVLYRATQER